MHSFPPVAYSDESGANSGGELLPPFHDARPIPLTRLNSVPRATRTPRQFGRCLSFKDLSLSPRAKPNKSLCGI
jgi:hypothetical protein